MRKLSFPNGKDKLIQEFVHLVLNCTYEPTFSNFSYAYHPKHNIHSAVAQIDMQQSLTCFIEGDILACFNEVGPRVLEEILRESINDERFIRLLNKLLNAGYLDTNPNFNKTSIDTDQSSICSPILANIYLDKLDKYMEHFIEHDTLGKHRKRNPEYSQTRYQLVKAKQNHIVKAIQSLSKTAKTLVLCQEKVPPK